MTGRVIIAGSTNTDLVVHTDRLPLPGETVSGGDLLTFAGGKGANQAVAAARAGASVRFIGARGTDAHGVARQRDLEKEGVDCRGLIVVKNKPSGVALIAIGSGKDGAEAENLIIVAPGANNSLHPALLIKALPKDLNASDVVLACLEIPLPSVYAAFRAAHTAKKGPARIVLNPAPFPSVGVPSDLLALVDFITPNESEFEGLTGVVPGAPQAPRELEHLFEKSKRRPVFLVTCGAQGVIAYLPDLIHPEQYRLAWKCAAPKVKAVDTVGAGDCFNGSLAAELARGTKLANAVKYAVHAAALKVTRHGAQAGMPKRKEVLRTM